MQKISQHSELVFLVTFSEEGIDAMLVCMHSGGRSSLKYILESNEDRIRM